MKTTKILKLKSLLSVVGFMSLVAIISSCEKETAEIPFIEDASENTLARAVYASRTVGFNKSDQTYTVSMANSDFGSVGGWSSGEADAYIRSNALRITLKANSKGTGSGMNSNANISDGTEYELEWKVKFNDGFEWSRGGKIGWGFVTGQGVTGCNGDDARAGQGGSFRVMWYSPDQQLGDTSGTAYFRPYAYYKGMTSNCGEDFGAKWPSSSSLQTGVWYTVKLYYKQNTSNSAANGKLKMWVNGNQVVSKSNIRWGDSTDDRKVKKLIFDVFRGGSQDYWKASTESKMRFDYVKWTRLAS
ncbi:hypothetical protein KIM67_10775 [Flagellimonas sp. 389]|uniref:polysaccharide lyase n=1 Tax=Flagellimonas sp. 389 TaxID=2835862 RepID=UPI001BD3BFE7|nr:hypothetical protein [Flagellimonas sp. 389]MBS9462897.1 hypothetical protein [Flagellimonas sp. 389]